MDAAERAHLVVVTVACVRCGAEIGHGCRTTMRRPTRRLHAVRWGMAQILACTCWLPISEQGAPPC